MVDSTQRYKAYPEYKDSGVEWLGEIPVKWQSIKIKYIARSIGTGSTPKNASSFTLEPGVSWFSPSDFHSGNILEKSTKYITCKAIKSNDAKIFKGESVLVIGIGATLGKVGHCSVPFSCNQQVNVITPNSKVDSYFLMYSLLVQKDQMNLNTNASTIGIMNQEKTKDLILALPTKAEQKQITNFLDFETAKIDILIGKQQRLIDLLTEKRQAVISHAVTKGLNPDAPMKDSGVEWLGEVPAHWEVSKAKYVSNVFVPQRNKPELNDTTGLPWITMEDMKTDYITNAYRFVTLKALKHSGSRVLQAGAVIASCVGNFGVTSINKVDVIINQQLQAFIPLSIKAEYLKAIVSLSKEYFELIGTSATLIYVNKEGFESLPVLIPTLGEQSAICEFINVETQRFDSLISKAQQAIQLMQERRTALISAAVTGKIDVRDWVKPE